MKRVNTYFKKRQKSIFSILEKKKGSYTTDTFHKLRVEIKKLNALFDLLNFCSGNLKANIAFMPFKMIFRQAGKVREHHVEAAMLKKYFIANLLKDYRRSLKKKRLKEEKLFFEITDKNFIKDLKKSFHSVEQLLGEVDKEKVNSYYEKEINQLKSLLGQKELQIMQIHEIRKQLKKLYYSQKITGLSKKSKSFLKNDILAELLGKWHDCFVTINHLKKTIDIAGINQTETEQLEKVLAHISSDSEILLKEINSTIAESGYFTQGNAKNNL